MKQRVLPILLSLALCLTLLPGAAWAADGPEPGGEQQNDPVTAQTKGDQGESGSSSAGGSTDTGSGGEDGGGGTDAPPPVGDGSEESPTKSAPPGSFSGSPGWSTARWRTTAAHQMKKQNQTPTPTPC